MQRQTMREGKWRLARARGLQTTAAMSVAGSNALPRPTAIVAVLAATMSVAALASAAPTAGLGGLPEPTLQTGTAEERQVDSSPESAESRLQRQRWMVTLEGITRAPVDIGAQVGLETPIGLRVSAGLGWVPAAYMNLVTAAVASTTNDARAEAYLRSANYEGQSWSAQVGYRPFSRLGFYFDAGYTRLLLNGTGDVTRESYPELAGAEGHYEAKTAIDLWTLCAGYELQPMDRLLLAAGIGVLGTLDAHTEASSTNPRASKTLLADAATRFDRGLKSYGIVPTLTLRAGFDFY